MITYAQTPRRSSRHLRPILHGRAEFSFNAPARRPVTPPPAMTPPPPDSRPQAVYAHTADTPEGAPLPESSGKWQPLHTHLGNVANLAAKFAAPINALQRVLHQFKIPTARI